MEEIVSKDGEDVRSCIVNIPKTRVFAKSSKDLIKICINRNPLKSRLDNRFRKPSESSLIKYSLPQAKPLRVKHCGKDEILLSFRQFAKQEHSIRHRQRMAIRSIEEYRIRSTNLRKRMHLECPLDEVIALTDIDKDFFNFINGRPLAYRGGDYKSIPRVHNYTLMKKIEVGYRLDTMLNINANYEKEQEEYDLSVARCKSQAIYFDKFISEDYQKSMAFLERWEEVKHEVILKNMELESLASDIFTITSRLVGLDYMNTLQHKYGRFLYYLSPPTWRAQNREFAQSIEIETEGFDPKGSNDEDSFSEVYEKLKKECAGNFVKPAIYFKDSTDIIEVFETIEMQQQYQFAHASRMAPLIKQLHIGIMNLKDAIAMDSASVVSAIESIEAQIKFYTERSQQLEEKFMKILHGLFYESVGTLEVLKFSLHLEFCFEKVLKEKPINMDITAMAKTLESKYFDYQMRLEAMQGSRVKEAIRECIQEEKIKYKKAKDASRELRLFERLEHELKMSFAPYIKREGKMIVPSVIERRWPTNFERNEKKLKNKLKVEKKSLTESEIEYLHLFTDWNENEDPSLYLHNYV